MPTLQAGQAAKANRIKQLAKAFTKDQAIEKIYQMEQKGIEIPVGNAESWYAVGFFGWGTHEEDLFYVETHDPIDAIQQFKEEVAKGFFTGHGSDNVEDRKSHPYDADTPETVLVYKMVDLGRFEGRPSNIVWTRVGA